MESETFKIQLNKFLKYKERTWSANSLRNNLYYFRLLSEFLDNKDFCRDTIEDFFSSIKSLSPNTRERGEASILAFVRWCFDEGLIKYNWANRIQKTRVFKNPRLLPSQTEVIRLIKDVTEPGKGDNVLSRFSKNEHRWCLLFIVTTAGTRNFETRQIEVDDVSLSTREILIKHGKNGPRTIAIPEVPWMINELKRRVEGRNVEELKAMSDRKHYKEDYVKKLFVVNQTRLEEIMREVGRRWIGKPLNVHDLRRICLRDLKNNGANIDDIKNVAGHSRIETTMGYLDYDIEGQKKTLKDYSTEAKKFRNKEEKSKELVNSAWKVGNVTEQSFDGEFLVMKVRII